MNFKYILEEEVWAAADSCICEVMQSDSWPSGLNSQ